MPEETAQERTEQPTPRKRRRARRKGTVARSADVPASLSLFAFAVLAPIIGSVLSWGLFRTLHQGLHGAQWAVKEGDLFGHFVRTVSPALIALLPLMLVSFIVGILSNVAQVGFYPSVEPLAPNWARLHPINGFRRLFSLKALFEFLKSAGKLAVIGGIVSYEIKNNWDTFLGLGLLTPLTAMTALGGFLASTLLKVSCAWIVIALADYLFQRKQIEKELMMSKEELKRELRETETSPELRAEMQRRRRRLTRQRMMANVKHADVVVTNPIEYAVALKYDPKRFPAPVVLAKGQRLMAERIKDEAKKHRIPIVPNPPLARSLFELVEVGEIIPTSLYQAVAEVLAFVFRQKGRRIA